jgi:hypothetical protein
MLLTFSSDIHNLVPLHAAFRCAMLNQEQFQMTRAGAQGPFSPDAIGISGQARAKDEGRSRSFVGRRPACVRMTFQEKAKQRPWPPWRLIATHANSEIAATHSQHRTSLFLTATRIVFLNSCFPQSQPPTAATPPRFGRSPNPIVTAQSNPSGEMRFLPQGGDNFSPGFDIVCSEDSGVPEVYNPDRFLRRHP